MNLMIDTNIFIDVLINREPFFMDSKSVLILCEEYKNLGYVLDIAKVLTVTNEDVVNAYTKNASDFEDCLLAVCAKSNRCDGIVTRNVKDFEIFDMTVYSPQDVLSLF